MPKEDKNSKKIVRLFMSPRNWTKSQELQILGQYIKNMQYKGKKFGINK